jgi:hypothetical protein
VERQEWLDFLERQEYLPKNKDDKSDETANKGPNDVGTLPRIEVASPVKIHEDN